MAEIKCIHLLVEGSVQGVGFRFFVQQQANALSLTGWVRNLMDDRVEILTQKNENKLTQLLTTVRVGPPMAHVTQVTVEWSNPVVLYKRFSIAPSE